MRAGVPVLNRRSGKPMRVRLPLRFGALISPCGPPGVMLSPMII